MLSSRAVERDVLVRLLQAVRAGDTSTEEALAELERPPIEHRGFAQVDIHRALRQGLPEVIFGSGKTREQVKGIAQALLDRGQRVLVTRLDASDGEPLAVHLRVALLILLPLRVQHVRRLQSRLEERVVLEHHLEVVVRDRAQRHRRQRRRRVPPEAVALHQPGGAEALARAVLAHGHLGRRERVRRLLLLGAMRGFA